MEIFYAEDENIKYDEEKESINKNTEIIEKNSQDLNEIKEKNS